MLMRFKIKTKFSPQRSESLILFQYKIKPMGDKNENKFHLSMSACGKCFAQRECHMKRTNIIHVNVNTGNRWTAVRGTVLKNMNCLKHVLCIEISQLFWYVNQRSCDALDFRHSFFQQWRAKGRYCCSSTDSRMWAHVYSHVACT